MSPDSSHPRPARSPAAAALASLVVPGLGQWLAGRRQRGGAVFGAALAAVVVLYWLGEPWAWLALVPLWLAAAQDAYLLAAGRPPHSTRLALLAALPLYVAGFQATQVDPSRLVSGFASVQPLFRALAAPDFVDRPREAVRAKVVVFTPCPQEPPAAAEVTDGAPSIAVEPACAPLGETIAVRGAGFAPESEVVLTWLDPQDNRVATGAARTGSDGRFSTAFVIPAGSIPEIYRDRVQRQSIEASVLGPPGLPQLSATLRLILASMGVTIAIGFLSTLLGALVAIPLSVLGARNLMGGSRASLAVYGVVRVFMNILRSIEPLILAVVFVVWVKQGPFAGMLALTLHTVAALGKLYSEQIEDIDPGPVDAIRATGASWLQTVVYAVFPQVIPPFTAFTVYRWDINVRMSTILGFVGGGGIGFLLAQWISKAKWAEAATAILVIAAVVIALDFLSARVRERINRGQPLVSPRWRPVFALGLALFTIWAWRTAEVEPGLLVENATKIRPIASELLHPTLVVRGVVTETARAPLIVPCGLAGVAAPPAGTTGTGPSLSLGAGCGDPGQRIPATGAGFAADSGGMLRWLMPDPAGGGLPSSRLPAGRVRTDAAGGFRTEVEVRPLLATAGAAAAAPIELESEIAEESGRPRLSPQVKITIDQLILTVLMALMATTFGAALALPVSLLGARNMMPRTALGNTVYYGTRTAMNLLRAIEPLILAAIFASWVGYGTPFAGVLALTIVTLANLGKLFSEAVENIDHGPLEAIDATGASRPQVVHAAVVPQVIPPFLAFGIYHWDINVRISTVIGFVGGGGIGFVLREWMNRLQWSWAAVAIIGIVIVVTAMDYLSLKVRERLV